MVSGFSIAGMVPSCIVVLRRMFGSHDIKSIPSG